jgi:hypothetical protein
MNKTLFFTITIGLTFLWVLVGLMALVFNEPSILYAWWGTGFLSFLFGLAMNDRGWGLID